MQVKVKVYKTEKRAREKFEALKKVDEGVADWAKQYPCLKFHPEYGLWTVTYYI